MASASTDAWQVDQTRFSCGVTSKKYSDSSDSSDPRILPVSYLCRDSVVDVVVDQWIPSPLKNAAFDSRVSVLLKPTMSGTLHTLHTLLIMSPKMMKNDKRHEEKHFLGQLF